MKKILLTLVGIICSLGMWADEATVYWESTLSSANEITLSSGFKLAITGNTGKNWSSGNGNITLNKTDYKTLKNSNGAQNTLTAPDGYIISAVKLYVVSNADASGYLTEFEGTKCSDEITSHKDYTNPTTIEKSLATPANSVTFTFGTKQVCFIAVVTYSADVKAAPTVTIPATAAVNTGVESTISATITANPAVTGIQWYSCEDADKTNPVAVEGQTTATLTYTPAAAGTYYYYCAATNSVGTTNSDVCTVTVTDRAKSSECDLTNLVLSNGFNTAIKDNTITGYYLSSDETAPTIKSATVSDYASYNLDGTTLTVTAEDGTTKEYTYTVTAVDPLTSTEVQTINSENTNPSWLKLGVWNSGKSSYEIYKSVDYRITQGMNRAYLFVGPCDAVVLTNSSSSEGSDRTGTYSVNGAAATSVTWPKYNEGAVTISIPCSTTGNNMIEIVNTATGGSWGFDAVQVMNYPTVTFSCTDEEVVGKTPVSQKITTGSFTIPTNITLYKEGYTLTAWNDGSADYAIGATYTPTADVTLTPVFTKNTVSLTDPHTEVTIKWDGNTYTDINHFTYQGNTGVYVAQANVNGKTIDVAMNVDATSGKFGNSSNNWCQCNGGTKLSFYAAKDAVVTLKSYNQLTATTIAGSVPTEQAKDGGNYVSTYNATADGDVEIVASTDLAWFGYLQVVLPATASIGTLNTKGYATFSSAKNVLISGAQAYTAELEGTTITCHKIENNIVPAYTGVILYSETASAPYTALYQESADALTVDNDLKATTTSEGTAAYESSLVLSGNTFVTFSGDTFTAGKAYFPYTSGAAKAFTIVFDDSETTAINAVSTVKAENNVRYNLAGQRVNATAKGIVIMNGKKYLNK